MHLYVNPVLGGGGGGGGECEAAGDVGEGKIRVLCEQRFSTRRLN